MKALASVRLGGPETLEMIDMPSPEPGEGQVRISVAACGINYPDALVITDRYQFRPERPFSPGAEVSGVVDAVGTGVTMFEIGDRVIGGAVFGGLAQKIVIDASSCYGMPAAMPFEKAAALLMTYGTSYYALKDRAGLKVGETLLVLGAAGGVGLAAVEIGKHMGARVIAGVSSAEKAAIVENHGADVAFIYPSGPFDLGTAKALTAQIRAAAGGDVDVIYDPVGGDYSEPALRTMAWGGRFLVVGFPSGIPKIPLNLPLLKGCDIRGVFWGSHIARFPDDNRTNVLELLDLYERGAIDPLVSERFEFRRGGDAISCLSNRRAIGKLVVDVAPRDTDQPDPC